LVHGVYQSIEPLPVLFVQGRWSFMNVVPKSI
jgi:hypothetical protein